MRIHVCVRSTLDWRDGALVQARILPGFRPKLDAWNATFDMPYHLFRQRLRDIARLNLSRVEGAMCAAVEDVAPGQVIVPIDDDDWLAPDLASHLIEAYEPSVRGYLWSSHVIELPRRIPGSLRRLARFLGRRDRHLCKTNNYAVVSEPTLRPFVFSHVKASHYFTANPSDVKRVPGVLAIQNRTLASQTVLGWDRPSISRDELVALLRRYRGLYSSWRLRAEAAWARPYVDMMAGLMEEIHVT